MTKIVIQAISVHPLTKRLFFILGIKAIIIALFIFFGGIGLGPDEAQYWTWSQNLDWGYYSKPPGIAWQIWLGTKLFGQTEWGVRSITVLLAFFQAWVIYFMALRSGLTRQQAYWCSLLMAFSPIGIFGSFFAITDVGFLLCWSSACLVVITHLAQGSPPSPILVGLWIFLGAFFKWPIYLFWPFFLACRYWYFPSQNIKQVFVGVLLSLLGLLPSLWWNWSHDWATFQHVFATVNGGSGIKAGGNFLSFIGAQAALLSPIIFLLLLIGLWQWLRQRSHLSPPLFFCGFVTSVLLICMALVSCFQKVQGNWILFAYPSGIILLGWYAFQHHTLALWTKVGVFSSFVLAMGAFLLPSFYTKPELSKLSLPFQLNPFKHNMGWDKLENTLSKHGYEPNRDFLFSDKYQASSILSFYGEGKKRAYFLNLNGVRKNQFSYWPSLHEEQKGRAGYFVWMENAPYLDISLDTKLKFYQTELEKYFEKVTFLESAPLIFDKSKIGKAAFIYRCENCKELLPPDSLLY